MSSYPKIKNVRHRFIQANGVKLHIAEAGKGPPLLMLHGWPQHWYMWRHQIPRLAKQYHVICPDLRGFGWSEAPESGYEKEQLVDDMVALLDALKIDRVRLLAHDWGGWVGFLLCLRQPKRVQRYLALNIPHPFQKIDSRLLTLWRFWYQVVIASPGLGSWIQCRTNFVKLLLKKAAVHKIWTQEELAIYADVLKQPQHAAASVTLYRSFLLKEFLPVITGRYSGSRLKTATLLLFGVDDFSLSTKLLQGYEKHADDLKVEFVSQSGHFIAEEQPKLVTERALEFFK